MKLKDELAGRKIRCPACKEIVAVPRIQENKTDDEALDVHVTEAPAKLKVTKPKPEREEDSDDGANRVETETEPRRRPPPLPDPDVDSENDNYGVVEAPKGPRRPPPLPDDDDDEDDDARRPRSIARRKKRYEPERGRTTATAEIVTGLLMMVGAVVWFGLGLFVGITFFYPPVLFFLGAAAVVRGIMGRS